MRGIMGGLLFIIGMLVLMVMWSPLVGFLLPLLDNSETVLLGGTVKTIITIIPAILVLTGVAVLASEAFGGGQQYQ